MNPVLLKPNTDVGAQIIIHRHAIGAMDARAYHQYKRVAHAAVMASYQRLCAQYRVILVEGAGSPAEINLRDRDIANMGFAEAADCPVLLVADIDRGGVFAHLVGTLALLSETERARIAGFVINRFRGDPGLLQPGIDWLKRPAVHLEDRREGALSADGQILGTYLHGLFESAPACDALLRWAGLREPQTPDYHQIRDANIDRLADACETHLDLGAIGRFLAMDWPGR